MKSNFLLNENFLKPVYEINLTLLFQVIVRNQLFFLNNTFSRTFYEISLSFEKQEQQKQIKCSLLPSQYFFRPSIISLSGLNIDHRLSNVDTDDLSSNVDNGDLISNIDNDDLNSNIDNGDLNSNDDNFSSVSSSIVEQQRRRSSERRRLSYDRKLRFLIAR